MCHQSTFSKRESRSTHRLERIFQSERMQCIWALGGLDRVSFVTFLPGCFSRGIIEYPQEQACSGLIFCTAFEAIVMRVEINEHRYHRT